MKLSLSVRIAEAPDRKDVAAVPIEVLAPLAKQAGFAGLSMRASVISVDSPPAQVVGLRRLLDELGLVVSMITGDVPIAANAGDVGRVLREPEPYFTLAEQLGCQHIHWENRGTGFADILINCTPVGMHPQVDDTPFQANWFREGMLVFDTIYNPENTLLLKQARERGCRVVSGIEMFIRQAADQFERFTGREAPLEELRQTLRRGISMVRQG